jgi:hypothetical protein
MWFPSSKFVAKRRAAKSAAAKTVQRNLFPFQSNFAFATSEREWIGLPIFCGYAPSFRHA